MYKSYEQIFKSIHVLYHFLQKKYNTCRKKNPSLILYKNIQVSIKISIFFFFFYPSMYLSMDFYSTKTGKT